MTPTWRPIIEIDVPLSVLLDEPVGFEYASEGYNISNMLIDMVWYTSVAPCLREQELEIYTDNWTGDVDFSTRHDGMIHFSYWPEISPGS
jgi:hypothetical protein